MKFIYLIIFSSFIYSECADNDQLNCNANCEAQLHVKIMLSMAVAGNFHGVAGKIMVVLA